MLEKLHDHLVEELGHSSRTDTIFIVVAVGFNMIALCINSAASVAALQNREQGSYNRAADIVLAIFIVMTILVNGIAVVGLFVGRQTRKKLLDGMIAMYSDHQVEKYYARSLVSNYGIRYILFAAAIILLALTAIFVPLVIRLIA